MSENLIEKKIENAAATTEEKKPNFFKRIWGGLKENWKVMLGSFSAGVAVGAIADHLLNDDEDDDKDEEP